MRTNISTLAQENEHSSNTALGRSLLSWGEASDKIEQELRDAFNDPERTEERKGYEAMYLRLTGEEKVDENNIQDLYNVLPSLLIAIGFSDRYGF